MAAHVRIVLVAFVGLLLAGACSSTPSSGGPAGSSGSKPGASVPAAASPPAASPQAQASDVNVGQPCSYLTAPEVEAIIGALPVEVEERLGRGDCDYWLDAAKDAKVNIGVFEGAEAATYFETTKQIGSPELVNVGDEAYSVSNEGFGTVVVARQGTTVVAVQVAAGALGPEQLRQATALVDAVLAGL